MWQLVKDKAGWTAYRDKVLAEIRVAGKTAAASISAEPHTFPCLVDAIAVSPGKVMYAFVYPGDFELFGVDAAKLALLSTHQDAVVRPAAAKAPEAQKAPVGQTDFNTHTIAYLLTLTHIVCDTLCVRHEDFENRFAEKLALVDQEIAAQRDGKSARSAELDVTGSKMFDRLI